MNPIVVALGVALLASIAGNALLFDAFVEAREGAAKIEQARKSAMDAAESCGAAVIKLQEAATKQANDAKAAIEAAQRFAGEQRRAAELERRRRQAVPGNACASAEVETREWLQRRREAAK